MTAGIVTRDDVREAIGRVLQAARYREDAMPTDPKLIRALDRCMEGVDLYVEGLRMIGSLN